MIDGAAHLSSFFHEYRKLGLWSDDRGSNLLDGGAPFYDVYACADADTETGEGYFSVGAIEPQFYKLLLKGLGLAGDQEFPAQLDQGEWPVMKERFASIFASKPRSAWEVIFNAMPESCCTPVLTLEEVAEHPHNKERGTFYQDEEGYARANPAPRLSRTPGTASRLEPRYAEHTAEFLQAHAGLSLAEVEALARSGAILDEKKPKARL
jgi:alpha-methylacyl-CoA racemase